MCSVPMKLWPSYSGLAQGQFEHFLRPGCKGRRPRRGSTGWPDCLFDFRTYVTEAYAEFA